ncbi:MAG: hypothetical protein A2Z29_07955 [Chloroflexi bacterium RBG_16_56_11]|nr:MAG: hypothetical protein A2Z29_07955 [Chloroflexi bacterium RBG_16_56_11]
MNNSSNIRNDTPDSQKRRTGSIAHASDVLVCLSNDIHTVTDISRQCHLGKSTVHRVLKLLEQSWLVVQDTSSRRYYLGPLVTRLASNPVTMHEYLLMFAGEEMKQLSRLSEDTVALDIMIGIRQFSLREIPSRHDLRVTQERRMGPVRSGASAKVLLSQLNDKQLRAALEDIEVAPDTDRTVTNKEHLMAQIKEVRVKEYAITYGEKIAGALCISAPVKNYSLPVALSVVGPESRLHPKAGEVLEALRAAVTRISQKLQAFPEKMATGPSRQGRPAAAETKLPRP